MIDLSREYLGKLVELMIENSRSGGNIEIYEAAREELNDRWLDLGSESVASVEHSHTIF